MAELKAIGSNTSIHIPREQFTLIITPEVCDGSYRSRLRAKEHLEMLNNWDDIIIHYDPEEPTAPISYSYK